MEQPSLPNSNPQKASKKKPPTPQELISHYQSQGLDSQQASAKVIEDLQHVLFRVVNKNNKDRLVSDTLRKVDAVHNRVAVVDMKLDTKPGYVDTLALGLASGAAFRGIESVWPHLSAAVSNIWTSVTKPPS